MCRYWSSRVPSVLMRTTRSTGSQARAGIGSTTSAIGSSSSSDSALDMEDNRPLAASRFYFLGGSGGFGSGVFGASGLFGGAALGSGALGSGVLGSEVLGVSGGLESGAFGVIGGTTGPPGTPP